jgi:hypothetical protein
MKRRDFVIRAALVSAILSGLMTLDQKEVTEDEKEIAREAMGLFIGTFPAGTEPTVQQVADKGRLAIRAWRELTRG